MTVLKFKINIKKSKIPKYIKSPKHVHPFHPVGKKPNLILNTKINIKKSEFLFEIKKNNLGYAFKRIDPYPHIWSGVNEFFLHEVKEEPKMFQTDFSDGIFSPNIPYCQFRLTFDEKYKFFANHIRYFSGKNKDKLKYYDETIVYFDLISKKEYKDIFDTLPSQIKKKLFSKENLKKSLKILEQKPRESKEFFTRRAFVYQNTFLTYDKYDLIILAKKLHELKYYVIIERESYSYKKFFFMFLEQYLSLYMKVLKINETPKALLEIVNRLSFDTNKKKHQKNLYTFLELVEEYHKSKN